MADYQTEEEQIELLKKWWNENGKATLGGVVIALAGYTGITSWNNHQQSTMAAAADIYQQMMTASEAPGSTARVDELAEQLRKEHRATVYGTFAALRLAKDAVAANDLPRAADMLAWAQGQKPDSSLQPLISLRLAQVQYAQGEYDKALATLLTQTSASPAWQAAIAELRGDVQLAQGKPDDARISYESALKAMETSGVQDRQKDIEMKKADLAKPGQTLTAGIGGHP